MKRKLLLLNLFSIVLVPLATRAHSPTWTDGIACIIYSHCTQCHNQSGIAPFSLMTYNDVYQNRFSIAASVLARSMPPFPPSQAQQKYAHANTLSQHEVDEIVDWVNNFAPLGNASQVPTPPVYASGYQLSNPDKILQIPAYSVNTTTDLYRCFVLPLNNVNEEYIQAIEVYPGNREIVHHALVFQDTSLIPLNLDLADPLPGYTAFGSTGSPSSKLIWGYTPGQGKFEYPPGFGAKVSANSYIVLQIHYPGGITGQTDSTQVRIKYGSGTSRNIVTAALLDHNATLVNGPLVIPPNQVMTFYNERLINTNAIITGVMPHMHLLGKRIQSFFVDPGGDTTVLVDIPEWDFHWQGFYQFQKPILVPAGSMLYGEATYDNTTANIHNPNNPPDTVRKGEGTGDEMFLIYFNFSNYLSGDTNIIIDTSSHFLHDTSCYLSTSLNNSLPDDDIRVYPNPAGEQVSILGLKHPYTLTIFDIAGHKISTQDYEPSSIILVSHLLPGYYQFRIEEGSNIITRRFLKQ